MLTGFWLAKGSGLHPPYRLGLKRLERGGHNLKPKSGLQDWPLGKPAQNAD